MFQIIKNFLSKMWRFVHDSHDSHDYCYDIYCYDMMEDSGDAAFNMCGGMVGGDSTTDNLSPQCIDCPYWTPVKLRNQKEP